MSAKSNAPVIIKRKKIIAGGGHHGGAWKVAIVRSFGLTTLFAPRVRIPPRVGGAFYVLLTNADFGQTKVTQHVQARHHIGIELLREC